MVLFLRGLEDFRCWSDLRFRWLEDCAGGMVELGREGGSEVLVVRIFARNHECPALPEFLAERLVLDDKILDLLGYCMSRICWPGRRAWSSRPVSLAGAGSAERRGSMCWPGWRLRSSASPAMAMCRDAEVVCSHSWRSCMAWAKVSSCWR